MRKETIEILSKPIELHTRPGGGKKGYTYIKGRDVVKRLNEAFNCDWSSEVKDTKVTDSYVVVLVSIKAEGVEHQAFGGAQIQFLTYGDKKGEPVDIQNAYKSAFTNALKKAAEQFGIGLDADDPDNDNSSPSNSYPSKPEYKPQAASNKPSPKSTNLDNNSVSASTVVKIEKKNDYPDGGSVADDDLDKLEAMLSSLMHGVSPDTILGSRNKLSDKDTNTLKKYAKMIEKTTGKAVMPPKKEFPTPTSQESPFDTSNIVNDKESLTTYVREAADGDMKITDVQVGALKGLAKSRGLTVIEAIRDNIKGSTKSDFDELTRAEARKLIRILNGIEM